jgi:hypothetical protein
MRRRARVRSWGIGLTPEVGGLASRPNHALTGVVTGAACGRGTGGSGLRPRLGIVRDSIK